MILWKPLEAMDFYFYFSVLFSQELHDYAD